MPRAGTGWLYDQLAHHPDFWMPPIKELRYLALKRPKLKAAARQLGDLELGVVGPRRQGRGLDERERAFLMDAQEIAGQPRDLQKYCWLFRHKGNLLSGDISPIYMTLPDDIVSEVGRHLPHVKIIFLVRDPLARAWSHICMAHRAGEFDTTLLDEPERFRAFLDAAPFIRRRANAMQVTERWRRCAPELAFQHYLFDDLQENSEAVRRKILEFLGADPEKPSGTLDALYNRKANAPMLPLEGTAKAVLIDYFRDEVCSCATEFGGLAAGWPAKYGLS
jgi:hypothetical protein